MKLLLAGIFFSYSLISMQDDVKIDVHDKQQSLNSSQNHNTGITCQCKLCKGIKIAVASNVISIITTAVITMGINYSQCDK